MIDIENLASQLLSKLNAGVQKIKDTGITHPVTIGNMYEGLTVKLLTELIQYAFPGVNMYIASNSFIEGSDTEYDVIISWGKGIAVPFSKGQRIFSINDVLAVIQVKSKLYYKAIDDSYENLRGIYATFDSIQIVQGDSLHNSAINRFAAICPSARQEDLNSNLYINNLFRATFMSEKLPIRIVWGYGGFKAENSLRNKIAGYYESRVGVKDFGPLNWPDIMICGTHSLIKQDAQPFYAPIEDISNCWWEFYSSTETNPFVLLFLMLRSRISRDTDLIESIEYPDLNVERASFFSARCVSQINAQQMSWRLICVGHSPSKKKKARSRQKDNCQS